MTRLSLSLLGGLRFLLDGRPVSGFAYNKARALLAYLAVEADRPHGREALVGLLWPELPDAAARANLRQALADLREAIGDASATPPFLLISRDSIQFNPSGDYQLDVNDYVALLAACEAHTHRHPERCRSCAARRQQAISLYHGDFLAGFGVGDSAPFEEWQLRQRERLHQQALDALARLASYHERRGDDEPARRYAQRQIELEPWREQAYRQLMRLLARDGQRTAALVQYETCRRVLARDLGVDPESETTALYEQIREGEKGRRGEGEKSQTSWLSAPPLVSSSPRHNFPAQTTPLLGRENELSEVGSLLENPACRLMTITGPGGIGKTRLALAAAAEQAEVFVDGAVFVPLQTISSATFLAPAILSSLDVSLQGQRDPREQLLDYLRGKQLLLVLDNFEQLLAPESIENAGGGTLLAEMLQHALGVTLLVTSRERLALPGEWLFDLAGLSYPAGHMANGIEDYDAVRLFTQRASQVRRQFALADGEVRAVARICRLVEGLPLAIELAASALRTRSALAIADAIESGMMSLTSELRAIPERQRSMWATFEHSWRLLSDEERQVLARLSVFRGGFEAEAAAQVARATPQFLAALVDKSLLRCDGAARYDLHELVRQYATEKLVQAGEMEQAHNTHLSHYLALAEAAEPKVVGNGQRIWLDRIDIEHNNVRAAMAWALEQGDSASALRLSGGIGRFWDVRGYWTEGRQWLNQTLALSREDKTGNNSASAIQTWTALALQQAGRLAWCQSDFASAQDLLEQSLALYQQVGNQFGFNHVYGLLGGLAFMQGDYATARKGYEEYLVLQRAVGDPVWIGDALFCVGLVEYHQGEYTAAQTLLEESLKLCREAGYELAITYPLNALGNLANLQGDYAAAQLFYHECLTLRRKLVFKGGIAITLDDMANVRVKLGQYSTARTLYEESLTLYRELGNKRGLVSVLSGLGCLAQVQGQLQTATRILSAVEALLVQLGSLLHQPQHSAMEQTIAAARAQLDETTFVAAWAEGESLTLEQAIAYALEGSVVDAEQPVPAAAAAKQSG